jgi:hypothetical protein
MTWGDADGFSLKANRSKLGRWREAELVVYQCNMASYDVCSSDLRTSRGSWYLQVLWDAFLGVFH